MRTRFLAAFVAGLVALAGAVVVVAPTYTALTNAAGLVIDAEGASTTSGAAGANSSFGLATIDAHGVVTKAPEGAPALIPIAVGHTFVCGQTLRVDLGVANDEPAVAADVMVAVLPTDTEGTGQVGTTPNITPFLLITVVDMTTGSALIGGSATDPGQGVSIAEASGMVGRLGARGAAALGDRAVWTGGAPGSRHDLQVQLYLPDTPALRALAGGRTALAVMFYGAAAR